MQLIKKIFIFIVILCVSHNLLAQSNTPIFVEQNRGNNVIVISKNKDCKLVQIAQEFNVTEELLAIFNGVEQNADFQAGQAITIPLTETNTVKNKNAAFNLPNFKALYHKTKLGQDIQDICKQYLLSPTTLKEWNAISNSNLQENTPVLVGWLKINDPSNGIENEKSTTYNNTNIIDNIAEGSKKVFNKFGQGLEKTGRNLLEAGKKINIMETDSIAYSAYGIDTVSMIDAPLYQYLRDDIFSLYTKEARQNTQKKIATGLDNTVGTVKSIFGNSKEKTKGWLEKNKQDKIARKAQAQKESYEKNKKLAEQQELALQQKQAALETQKNKMANEKLKLEPSEKVESIYDLAGQSTQNNTLEGDNGDIEIIEKPRVPNSAKSLNGKATWFYVGSTGGTYYVFCNYAPKGATIRLTNANTNSYIDAKVLGSLTTNETKSGLVALVSDNAKEALGVENGEFSISLSNL